jgi:hypothetical protein
MFRQVVSLILCGSLLVGCASVYKGPEPNLELKGAEGQLEYTKFKLRETFWHQSAQAYQMGPDQKLYTVASLRPVLQKVSPESVERIDNSLWYTQVGVGLLVGAVVILGLQIANPVNYSNTGLNVAYFALIGASVGFSFARIAQFEDAARDYNRNLKSKLAPDFAMSWKW